MFINILVEGRTCSLLFPTKEFLNVAHEKIKVSQFIENREPSAGRDEFCSMKNEEAFHSLLVEPLFLLKRFFVVNLNPVLSTSIYPKLGGRTQQSLKLPSLRFQSFLWFTK